MLKDEVYIHDVHRVMKYYHRDIHLDECEDICSVATANIEALFYCDRFAFVWGYHLGQVSAEDRCCDNCVQCREILATATPVNFGSNLFLEGISQSGWFH